MPMPPVFPGARRVPFSDAAALRAIADLESLTDELRALRRGELEAVVAPTTEWRGPTRDSFDRHRNSRLAVLDSAIVRVGVLRQQIVQQQAAAAFEQIRANQIEEMARGAELARLAELPAN